MHSDFPTVLDPASDQWVRETSDEPFRKLLVHLISVRREAVRAAGGRGVETAHYLDSLDSLERMVKETL